MRGPSIAIFVNSCLYYCSFGPRERAVIQRGLMYLNVWRLVIILGVFYIEACTM